MLQISGTLGALGSWRNLQLQPLWDITTWYDYDWDGRPVMTPIKVIKGGSFSSDQKRYIRDF